MHHGAALHMCHAPATAPFVTVVFRYLPDEHNAVLARRCISAAAGLRFIRSHRCVSTCGWCRGRECVGTVVTDVAQLAAVWKAATFGFHHSFEQCRCSLLPRGQRGEKGIQPLASRCYYVSLELMICKLACSFCVYRLSVSTISSSSCSRICAQHAVATAWGVRAALQNNTPRHYTYILLLAYRILDAGDLFRHERLELLVALRAATDGVVQLRLQLLVHALPGRLCINARHTCGQHRHNTNGA